MARRLPEPPPEAARWYQRGTEFIREGAFHSATAALDQAIASFPEFPLAYARQAEALAELDDPTRASDRLLRMQAVLVDEARLDGADRLRLRGIRALVLRDLGDAVTAYSALVERTPGDAGAWLDLGRAQETAELRAEARQSYMRALAIDAALAPAHLRLASLDAQAGRRDGALAAFAAAERLYRASSNAEGETEVLLRRGGFLDAVGAADEARADLERAQSLADGARSRAQLVRARLALGSLTATQDRYVEAERLVASAIADARTAELWTLVADGLIDLARVLVNQSNRLDEADRQTQEAIRLAEERGAHRTAARAALQRAALALQRGQPGLARDLSNGALPFLSGKGNRRLELTALTIRSRADRDAGELAAARDTAARVPESAKALADEARVASALVSISGIALATGDLPAALAARDDAAQRHAAMGLLEEVPYDLGARAELLIRLGRGAEAQPLLQALDAGIQRGDEAFTGRTARLRYLRALAAVVDDAIVTAAEHARAAVASSSHADAEALLAYVTARLGRPRTPAATQAVTAPPSDREHVYWYALEALARGRDTEALSLGRHGLALAEKVGNVDLTWRLAAIGAAAAKGLAPTRRIGSRKPPVRHSRPTTHSSGSARSKPARVLSYCGARSAAIRTTRST
jgi:tetratricopeptide (TPR) repeat protein